VKLELETDNKGILVALFVITTVNASSKCLAVWKLDKFSVMFDESKSPACNHGHRDASSWTEAIRCSVT